MEYRYIPEIRDNVRTLLDQHETGMKALASSMDLSYSHVSMLMSMKRQFNETLLVQVARYFNVQPHKLLEPYKEKRGAHEMPELKELVELLQIPTIRRGILSRLDDLKAIHKDLILDHQKKTQESPPM